MKNVGPYSPTYIRATCSTSVSTDISTEIIRWPYQQLLVLLTIMPVSDGHL